MRHLSTLGLAVAAVLALGAATGPAPPPQSTEDDCLGAVVHTIDAGAAGPPSVSLCITLGGVVRLVNLGPGMLHADSPELVSCSYAAGVHGCRMIYTGTVRFTTSDPAEPREFVIEIAGAVTPPRPSPACSSETFTLDAAEYGPPWIALCVQRGTRMRVENLGTGGFTVSPAGALSCRTSGDVRICRFVEVATVNITVTLPEVEPRELIVVVIR